ncbi:MAG: hypothetical protein Q8T08_17465, partial [Ignavibacteria bacterium]|nr:hypothetical protein [Ignavibacteria bacterium]
MYANTIKSIIFGLILLISCNNAIAQDAEQQGKQPSTWQIGGFGGFSQYYGDVSNKSFFQKFSGETKVSFGFLVRHHFNENFGLGVNFSRSNIYSTKDVYSTGAPLNMQYSGWLNQVSAHSYMNFSNFFWGYSDRKVNWFGT